jgi:acetyl esterase/lipase
MIELWSKDDGAIEEAGRSESPHLIPFLLTGNHLPCVIVCPGGGYQRLAQHEGEPVAEWLNSIGISAFVLKYRVAPHRHPTPLNDAKRAIRIVRSRAAEWGVDPNRIGILGFSAGGHVACSAGTHYDLGDAGASDPIERISSRPDLMVLCYPVISFGEHAHQGSVHSLLGDEPTDELKRYYSNQLQVTPDTPPAFLWHTADDASVPVENSLMFASALSRNGVPFDLHCYESGRHGLGLATEHAEAFAWTKTCELWLRRRGF